MVLGEMALKKNKKINSYVKNEINDKGENCIINGVLPFWVRLEKIIYPIIIIYV